MKKAIVILSALFLLTLGTAKAEPTGRGHMGREMMDNGPGYYAARLFVNPTLNLTAEQIIQIHALDEKYAQEIKFIQAQLYSKGKALKSEWLQARPDRGQITAHQCDVTNLRNQMREKMTSHRTDVLEVLTPEQQAQMQDNGPGRDFYKKAAFGRQ